MNRFRGELDRLFNRFFDLYPSEADFAEGE